MTERPSGAGRAARASSKASAKLTKAARDAHVASETNAASAMAAASDTKVASETNASSDTDGTGSRRRSPSRRPTVRDTDETAFGAILGELVARLPGAFACALVDLQGETVDYAGQGDAFDIKVAAAHLRILLCDLERYGAIGEPRWMVLRGARRSFITRRLPHGYALIVLLRRRAGFTVSARAFAACERALAVEAGWKIGDVPSWFAVSVDVDRRGRPLRVGTPSRPVEVFGAVMGLPARERGFRVRIANGSELMLIREGKRSWYADTDLGA